MSALYIGEACAVEDDEIFIISLIYKSCVHAWSLLTNEIVNMTNELFCITHTSSSYFIFVHDLYFISNVYLYDFGNRLTVNTYTIHYITMVMIV